MSKNKKNKELKLDKKQTPRPPRPVYNWRRKIAIVLFVGVIAAIGCYVSTLLKPKAPDSSLWKSRNGDYEVTEVEPGYYFFDHKHDQCLADIVALNIEKKNVLYLQNARGECFRVYTKTGKIESWDNIESAPQDCRKFFETYCYEVELPEKVAKSVVARYYRNRYVVFKRDDGKEYFWGTDGVKGDFTPDQDPYRYGERPLQKYAYDEKEKTLSMTFDDGTKLTVPPAPLYNKIDGKEFFK